MKARISINGKRIEKTFKTKEEAIDWKIAMIEKHSDNNIPGEVWKQIPGFLRYQASNAGRLRSSNYKNSGLTKILKPALSEDGYYQIMLKHDSGKYKSWKVHKFITLAFYGEKSKGLEVNHKDGIKVNNVIDNLEYCTHSENCQHSFDIGLQEAKAGHLNGMAKLTSEQVKEAREAKENGGRFWGRNEMAERFGISAKHLQKIVNNPGTIWNNV